MSDLVVVAFPEQELAFELRAELAKMQKAYLIDIEDIVVATRDDNGKVKLHQAMNLTSAGAVGGGFWGMLIGLVFLNPLLGAAIGAGAGALSGRFTDIGINDEFMKQLAQNFQPGCAAVFILLRKVTADKVLEGLADFRGKGKVLQTSLEKDREDTLREFLEAQAQEGTT
jgi:uncharacterized membrane protein